MAQRSSIQAKQLNSTEDVAQVSLPSTPSQTSATRPASSSAAHIVIAGLPEAEGLLSTAPTKSNRQRKSRTAEPESTDQTESNRGNDQMIIEGNSNDGFAPAADGIDNANAQTNSYGIREVVSSRSRKEAQRRNEKGKQPAIAPGPPNLLTRTRSSTSTLIAQDDEHISTTADASTVSKSKEAVYGHVHEALKELERGITVSRAHAALRDYYFYAEALCKYSSFLAFLN
ncbi:hypothetical protein BJ742DRAFT_437849 [Cladochytrium replicatum]|nr:hypothetical protein BJ742DRAFT_437849 [Cladochytrium replicatum]